MKKNKIEKANLNNKGITLISLIITIVIMLIIVSISANIGTESLEATRLNGFYMQLETVQKRVDDIAITNEKYVNSEGNTIEIKEHEDFKLTESEKTALANTGINLEEIKTGLTADDFRYFTVEELDTVLDLMEMDYNVFIHFDTRTVIAENGITINGEQYYMLKSNIYFPEYEKKEAEIKLSYEGYLYGTESYKIIVIPEKVGYLETNGMLMYKKTTTKYWEIADGLEIIVNELTIYDIQYKDRNNTIVSKKIKLELDGEEVKISEIEE